LEFSRIGKMVQRGAGNFTPHCGSDLTNNIPGCTLCFMLVVQIVIKGVFPRLAALGRAYLEKLRRIAAAGFGRIPADLMEA
jgi:hypothetical protein